MDNFLVNATRRMFYDLQENHANLHFVAGQYNPFGRRQEIRSDLCLRCYNQEDDLSGQVWKDNSECCLFLSPNQSTIKNLFCCDNRSFRLHLRPVAFIRAKLCLLYIMLIPTEIRTSKEKYFTLNVDQAAYYLSNTYFLLAGVGNFL